MGKALKQRLEVLLDAALASLFMHLVYPLLLALALFSLSSATATFVFAFVLLVALDIAIKKMLSRFNMVIASRGFSILRQMQPAVS